MEFCRCLLYLCCIKKPKHEDSDDEYEGTKPKIIESKDYEKPSLFKEKISSVYKMVSSFSVPVSSWSLPKTKQEERMNLFTMNEEDFDEFEKLDLYVDKHI